jgi:aspartate ammonia-lyase
MGVDHRGIGTEGLLLTMVRAMWRIEHDLLGMRDVPADAYFGIHTLRALENFPITGTPVAHYPLFINALATVKQAAARTNCALGLLDQAKGDAIDNACEAIRQGAFHEEFVVDMIQGGAGTSTNMNANEVIANRGLEIMGFHKGDYEHLHPLNDVNMGQSTNDAYPTALKVATHAAVGDLHDAMRALRESFSLKATEFEDVLKMGRTQLQDAVPMSLGQEFTTYAVMIDEDIERLTEARALMREVNLGGTAIGTGINTDARYSVLAIAELARITGVDFVPALNLIEATQDVGSFVQVSSVLKRIAIKLSKTCNDLRLLSSGPRAGFGEINLPPRQAGSSIMPGKVNPVIPEVVNQIAYEVIGNDVTVSMAAEAGQLQLNAFEPIIAFSLFKSLAHLTAGCRTLAQFCVAGITANRESLFDTVARSIGLVTALSPLLGYDVATSVAQDALDTNRSVIAVVLERHLMTKDELDRFLDLQYMISPGMRRPLTHFPEHSTRDDDQR